MRTQVEIMQGFINTAKQMLADNERLIADNERILESYKNDKDRELSRQETRVIKEDAEEPVERRLTGAKIISANEETGRITLEISMPSLRGLDNRAYSTEDDPKVLRWNDDGTCVPTHVCMAIGWPYIAEQQQACKAEFNRVVLEYVNDGKDKRVP